MTLVRLPALVRLKPYQRFKPYQPNRPLTCSNAGLVRLVRLVRLTPETCTYISLHHEGTAPNVTTARIHSHGTSQEDAASTPLPPKQLYRVPEAMVILSLKRSTLYELIRSGRLRSVKEGNSRLISAGAIAEYVALLETEASEPLELKAAS